MCPLLWVQYKFCIFAYNVQPGITIDYATGESSGEEYRGSETADSDGVDFASPAVVMAVQAALNNAGYDCGTPDGIEGRNTLSAVEHCRSEKGISGSSIDAFLAMALGLKAYDLLTSQGGSGQEMQSQATTQRTNPQTSASETSVPETSAPVSSGTTYVVNKNTRNFTIRRVHLSRRSQSTTDGITREAGRN